MPYGAPSPRIRANKYTSIYPNKQGSIHTGFFYLLYNLLPYGISSTKMKTSASPLSSFFAAIDEIGIGQSF